MVWSKIYKKRMCKWPFYNNRAIIGKEQSSFMAIWIKFLFDKVEKNEEIARIIRIIALFWDAELEIAMMTKLDKWKFWTFVLWLHQILLLGKTINFKGIENLRMTIKNISMKRSHESSFVVLKAHYLGIK